jgi:hypothetical protein
MTGTRWSRAVAAIAAGGLTLALVACGPSTSAGSLQSVGTPSSAAVTSGSSAAVPSSPAAQPSSVVAPTSVTAAAVPVTTSTPEATTTAAPAKAGSTISASVGKDTVRYGDQASIDVSVQAPGAPAGTDLTGHVTLLDGAETVDEGDADSSGTVTLSFLNRADPGAKTYTINYSGGAAVDAATAELTVQTTQTNVDIAVDWADGLKPGDDATIRVDIVGTPDSPTGDVTISYDGNQITSGPVDANGKITAAATAVTAGDHQIKVSYAGDARFEPNTATSTLTVKDPVANPNAAGAAATQASNPCPAAASACVDLANEQAWLQNGGQITYGPVPITSGAYGSRTRDGMFSVFWRDKNHKSSLFNNAPMPNSVFFDNDIAFHQGSLSNQSNGCVHLSWDASETFYDTLSVGDAVYVWGSAPY